MYAGALAAAKQLLAGPEKNSSIFFKSLVILIFLVHHTAAEAIKTPDPLQKHLVTISLVLDLMALLMSSFLNHAGNLEILDELRTVCLPPLKLLSDWLVSNPILSEQEKCDALLAGLPELVGIHTEASVLPQIPLCSHNRPFRTLESDFFRDPCRFSQLAVSG